MAGQVIALHSADAGDTALQTPIDGTPALKLYDFSGQPVTEWDRRGYERVIFFDALRQPVGTHVKGLGLAKMVERTVRSEERRVGKECVSRSRSRGSPNH